MKYLRFLIVVIVLIGANKLMGHSDTAMLVGLVIGSGFYILSCIDKTE